jgi:hypothetical protein
MDRVQPRLLSSLIFSDFTRPLPYPELDARHGGRRRARFAHQLLHARGPAREPQTPRAEHRPGPPDDPGGNRAFREETLAHILHGHRGRLGRAFNAMRARALRALAQNRGVVLPGAGARVAPEGNARNGRAFYAAEEGDRADLLRGGLEVGQRVGLEARVEGRGRQDVLGDCGENGGVRRSFRRGEKRRRGNGGS